MTPAISVSRRVGAFIGAVAAQLIGQVFVALLLKLSVSSLSAALILSVLFFPVPLILVSLPMYKLIAHGSRLAAKGAA